jgi:hypothetical protein
MTYSIKANFNIDDLVLDNPRLYKNKTYFKILNPHLVSSSNVPSSNQLNPLNKQSSVLINLNNVILVDEKEETIKFSLDCITNIENRTFLSLLDKKIENLYYELIDKKKEVLYYYDSILKLNNLQIISKFVLNKQLHLIEKLDITKKYNINLELYSISLDNNVIKVLWKLKSLEIIENHNVDFDEDEINILNEKINTHIQDIRNQANDIRNQVKNELDKIKIDFDNINSKYNKLDNLYKNILDENNIENIENIYKLFLENK